LKSFRFFVIFIRNVKENDPKAPKITYYGALHAKENALLTRDRCYDFLNIFAKKFCEKIGGFCSKQS
jgi:hypothetical protein